MASAAENGWEGIKSKMNRLRADKDRVVFYIGAEAFYRKVLCAAILVQTPKGVAWISEGVKRKMLNTSLALHSKAPRIPKTTIFESCRDECDS